MFRAERNTQDKTMFGQGIQVHPYQALSKPTAPWRMCPAILSGFWTRWPVFGFDQKSAMFVPSLFCSLLQIWQRVPWSYVNVLGDELHCILGHFWSSRGNFCNHWAQALSLVISWYWMSLIVYSDTLYINIHTVSIIIGDVVIQRHQFI